MHLLANALTNICANLKQIINKQISAQPLPIAAFNEQHYALNSASTDY